MVFVVDIQFALRMLRRIGQAGEGGQIEADLLPQEAPVDPASAQDPFLRPAHAEKACSVFQLELIGFLRIDGGAVAPEFQMVQAAVIYGFAAAVQQEQASRLLVLLAAPDRVQIPRLRRDIHGGQAGAAPHHGQLCFLSADGQRVLRAQFSGAVPAFRPFSVQKQLLPLRDADPEVFLLQAAGKIKDISVLCLLRPDGVHSVFPAPRYPEERRFRQRGSGGQQAQQQAAQPEDLFPRLSHSCTSPPLRRRRFFIFSCGLSGITGAFTVSCAPSSIQWRVSVSQVRAEMM